MTKPRDETKGRRCLARRTPRLAWADETKRADAETGGEEAAEVEPPAGETWR